MLVKLSEKAKAVPRRIALLLSRVVGADSERDREREHLMNEWGNHYIGSLYRIYNLYKGKYRAFL